LEEVKGIVHDGWWVGGWVGTICGDCGGGVRNVVLTTISHLSQTLNTTTIYSF